MQFKRLPCVTTLTLFPPCYWVRYSIQARNLSQCGSHLFPLDFPLYPSQRPSPTTPTSPLVCLIAILYSSLSLGQVHLRLFIRILPPSRRSQHHRISRLHRPKPANPILISPINISRDFTSRYLHLLMLRLLVSPTTLYIPDKAHVPGHQCHYYSHSVLGHGEWFFDPLFVPGVDQSYSLFPVQIGIWTDKIGFHHKWEFWLYNVSQFPCLMSELTPVSKVVFGLGQAPYYAYAQTMMSDLTPPGYEGSESLRPRPLFQAFKR